MIRQLDLRLRAPDRTRHRLHDPNHYPHDLNHSPPKSLLCLDQVERFQEVSPQARAASVGPSPSSIIRRWMRSERNLFSCIVRWRSRVWGPVPYSMMGERSRIHVRKCKIFPSIYINQYSGTYIVIFF